MRALVALLVCHSSYAICASSALLLMSHLQILTAKLYRLSGENLLKRLHIIEVYAEMCDIMIEFNIEQFEDSEDSEEQESEEK